MNDVAHGPDIHIRCKACRQYLAGPLACKPPNRQPDLGFHEYMEMRNVDFGIDSFFEVSPESELDLFLHAQWYDSWAREWSERSDGASIREMAIKTAGAYGCCGPVGDAVCGCGAALGRVWADCMGPHWIFLFDSRIERSDRVDGVWTCLSDADTAMGWIESIGEFRDGVRHGDWES